MNELIIANVHHFKALAGFGLDDLSPLMDSLKRSKNFFESAEQPLAGDGIERQVAEDFNLIRLKQKALPLELCREHMKKKNYAAVKKEFLKFANESSKSKDGLLNQDLATLFSDAK